MFSFLFMIEGTDKPFGLTIDTDCHKVPIKTIHTALESLHPRLLEKSYLGLD